MRIRATNARTGKLVDIYSNEERPAEGVLRCAPVTVFKNGSDDSPGCMLEVRMIWASASGEDSTVSANVIVAESPKELRHIFATVNLPFPKVSEDPGAIYVNHMKNAIDQYYANAGPETLRPGMD